MFGYDERFVIEPLVVAPGIVVELTVRDVSVPTEVMFGCALPDTAVATPEVETEPTMLDAFRADRPEPFPEYEPDVRRPELVCVVEESEVSVVAPRTFIVLETFTLVS